MKLADVLGIIAWGVILVAIALILLKLAGVIHSPSVQELLLSAVLAELVRVELEVRELKVKVGLLWKDFSRRKKLS